MKNKKGFTLVETLAVIILLGVILGIAVPSINNVVARNRKSRFREATEMFVVLAKQKLETDTSIEYPQTKGKSMVVMTLDTIDITQLENIVGETAKEGAQIKWKSTENKSSKVVFKYNGSKWENIFVVLYDGEGNAFYYDNGKIVSGNDTLNSNFDDKDAYNCKLNTGGYCYG